MAKKITKLKKYSAEFKIRAIMDMREHRLSYNETARKYGMIVDFNLMSEALFAWSKKWINETN